MLTTSMSADCVAYVRYKVILNGSLVINLVTVQ